MDVLSPIIWKLPYFSYHMRVVRPRLISEDFLLTLNFCIVGNLRSSNLVHEPLQERGSRQDPSGLAGQALSLCDV